MSRHQLVDTALKFITTERKASFHCLNWQRTLDPCLRAWTLQPGQVCVGVRVRVCVCARAQTYVREGGRKLYPWERREERGRLCGRWQEGEKGSLRLLSVVCVKEK